MVATLPATPRHMSQSLPLLPSGPGGVRNLSLRGDQQSHHNLSACTMPENRSKLKGEFMVFSSIRDKACR